MNQHRYCYQPHPVTPAAVTAISDCFLAKKGKRRGNNNCGQPKKGHVCHLLPPSIADSSSAAVTSADSSTSSAAAAVVTVSPVCDVRTVQRQRTRTYSNLRRALSFDDMDVHELPESNDEGGGEEEVELDVEVDIGSGRLPVSCLWEVLRRLPPPALLSAAKKCPALVRLSLTMQSDMDSTMLACIAFACPNLESLEILMCEGSFNRITGDELGRFVADKCCLTTLKMEGCSNLGAFVLCSNTLSSLSSSLPFCCAFSRCCTFKGIAYAVTCTWIRNY
ncbi:hypothetical protein L1987_27991 [Smallanthus sonchifolius]|uniref:Uncharacterized protein n=1 Tax=Smallanthus sonchifolius TaxID=185202 RepID=A0ACB9IDC2_9ASTR|nr:hypothetical protein L1987_27991 [Smallanthus sonchifolius]